MGGSTFGRFSQRPRRKRAHSHWLIMLTVKSGCTVLVKKFTGGVCVWPGLRETLHSRIDAPGATFQAAIASRSWRAARASNAAASLARVKFAMSLVLEPQRARHMPDHLASGSIVATTRRPSLNSRSFHASFILHRQLSATSIVFRGEAAAAPVHPWSCHPRRTQFSRSTYFGRNVASTG